jgi:hypothetical protein
MMVNQGTWAQESWDTGNPAIRARIKNLRARGYEVMVSSLGMQVTPVGVIKMTMIDIRPRSNTDTCDIGNCGSPKI